MAVRIDLFTITGPLDFELVPPAVLDAAVAAFDSGTTADDGPVRCVGWLSASDEDEAAFTGWCDALDDDLGIGLLHQGLGEGQDIDPGGLAASPGGPEAGWTAAVQAAVVAAAGGRLGWRTDFDDPGTVPSDPEHPTASHPAEDRPPISS